MVLIGLLLIAAAVAAAIILVVQNDDTIAVHVFDTDYDVAAYWLAIAGLAIMAVLALGLWAVRVGAAHRIRRRRERRELVRENRRLSERAAAVNEPGAGQPSTRLRHGTAAGGTACDGSAADEHRQRWRACRAGRGRGRTSLGECRRPRAEPLPAQQPARRVRLRVRHAARPRLPGRSATDTPAITRPRRTLIPTFGLRSVLCSCTVRVKWLTVVA